MAVQWWCSTVKVADSFGWARAMSCVTKDFLNSNKILHRWRQQWDGMFHQRSTSGLLKRRGFPIGAHYKRLLSSLIKGRGRSLKWNRNERYVNRLSQIERLWLRCLSAYIHYRSKVWGHPNNLCFVMQIEFLWCSRNSICSKEGQFCSFCNELNCFQMCEHDCTRVFSSSFSLLSQWANTLYH